MPLGCRHESTVSHRLPHSPPPRQGCAHVIPGERGGECHPSGRYTAAERHKRARRYFPRAFRWLSEKPLDRQRWGVRVWSQDAALLLHHRSTALVGRVGEYVEGRTVRRKRRVPPACRLSVLWVPLLLPMSAFCITIRWTDVTDGQRSRPRCSSTTPVHKKLEMACVQPGELGWLRQRIVPCILCIRAPLRWGPFSQCGTPTWSSTARPSEAISISCPGLCGSPWQIGNP